VGINIKVEKNFRQKDVITVAAKLERDLKSCMRCRFFYGNNRQCIAKKCIKNEVQEKRPKQEVNSMCVGCPYRQSELYCFPCMKRLIGKDEKETEIVGEMEETKDGQTC